MSCAEAGHSLIYCFCLTPRAAGHGLFHNWRRHADASANRGGVMTRIKMLIARALRRFNIVITRGHTFDRLIQSERDLRRLGGCWDFLRHVGANHVHRALKLLADSHGENFQDLFAALLLGHRENGFFVEFGATDGVTGSNTLLFEKCAGWNGIIAEPARVWHEKLAMNRRCMISHECVWRTSGHQVEFCETGDAGFSTIARFADSDRHASKRQQSTKYSVPTISLDDLLARHSAPASIDFLSLDTEGSEFDILAAFSFDRYRVSVLVVEHNFRPEREALHELLTRNAMIRVLPELSRYDDWYVADDLVARVKEIFPGAAIARA